MKDIEISLRNAIEEALHSIEESGDIVITSGSLGEATKLIAEKTKEIYTGNIFTPAEMVLLRQLAAEAAINDKLFCGELQLTTGYTKEEMLEFSEKLREFTNYY